MGNVSSRRGVSLNGFGTGYGLSPRNPREGGEVCNNGGPYGYIFSWRNPFSKSSAIRKFQSNKETMKILFKPLIYIYIRICKSVVSLLPTTCGRAPVYQLFLFHVSPELYSSKCPSLWCALMGFCKTLSI